MCMYIYISDIENIRKRLLRRRRRRRRERNAQWLDGGDSVRKCAVYGVSSNYSIDMTVLCWHMFRCEVNNMRDFVLASVQLKVALDVRLYNLYALYANAVSYNTHTHTYIYTHKLIYLNDVPIFTSFIFYMPSGHRQFNV